MPSCARPRRPRRPQARGAADARAGSAAWSRAARGAPTIRDARAVPAPTTSSARASPPHAPERLWVADITYLPTLRGLALPGRASSTPSAAGSSAGRSPTTCAPSSSLDALRMAIARRRTATAARSSITRPRAARADSTGRRNTSMVEVSGGDDAGAAAGGSAVSGAGALAGAADGGVARGSGPVLGRGRSWAEDRGRGGRGGCVVAGGVPVVPPRWRRESLSFSNGVGPLPVVRRAGGDRAPPSSGSWCAGDRAAAAAQPVDDLAGAAPQRVDADVAARVQGVDRAVACRASCPPAEGGQAGRERTAPRVRAGAAVGCGARCRRSSCRAAGAEVERAGTSRIAGIAAGCRAGARSRSRAGCGSTSPMMSRCGSATKRSTRPSTCRAAGRSSASWSRACAPDGRCGCRGPAPARRRGRTSRPR